MSFSLSNSSQKLPFFAVLMYALYGHPGYFKFKRKRQQYGPCFQTIFLFLMTMIKVIIVCHLYFFFFFQFSNERILITFIYLSFNSNNILIIFNSYGGCTFPKMANREGGGRWEGGFLIKKGDRKNRGDGVRKGGMT